MAKLSNKLFDKQLKKYLSVVDKEGTKGIRSVTLQGLSMIMRKSPVDKGTFRGNWNVGIGVIDTSTDYGRREFSAMREGNSVVGSIKGGDDINISNALPYAMRLEFGYSSQAKNGMVRTTKTALLNWLKKQNRKV